MFLSAIHPAMQAEAMNYCVFDKDTGKEIKRVVWANDETGRYRQLLTDSEGRYIVDGDHVKSKIFTGNIELKRCEG